MLDINNKFCKHIYAKLINEKAEKWKACQDMSFTVQMIGKLLVIAAE